MVSEAVIIVCSVDEHGKRDVFAIEPMAEESHDSCKYMIEHMKKRGLRTLGLIISDAYSGLASTVKQGFLRHLGSTVKCILCGISWLTYLIPTEAEEEFSR